MASPVAFQTIFSYLGLFTLNNQRLGRNPNDQTVVHELISKIMAGKCGHLDMDELEQKFQALALKTDTEDDLRGGLGIEAFSRCLGAGSLDERRLMLETIEVRSKVSRSF